MNAYSRILSVTTLVLSTLASLPTAGFAQDENGSEPAAKVDLQKKKHKLANVDVGMSFNVGKTEYVTDKGDAFKLDRSRFGLGLSYGVGDGKTVQADFQRIIRSEVVDAKEINGDGYQFGFGFRSKITTGSDVGVVPFLRFDYVTEEFLTSDDVSIEYNGRELNYDRDTKIEISQYEFTVGALAEFSSTPDFTPFIGVEIFPMSEGEWTTKKQSKQTDTEDTLVADNTKTKVSSKIDFERDDIMNLVFGARTGASGFWVGGRAELISETTFALEAGFKF